MNFKYQASEKIFWLCISMLMLLPVFLGILDGLRLSTLIDETRLFILMSFVSMFFPSVYNLIFGELPFETIRNQLERQSHGSKKHEETNVNPNNMTSIKTEPEEAEDFILNLVIHSRDLSRKIYLRSGLYLVIGVTIAFSGLIFFYLHSNIFNQTQELIQTLLNLSPSFGILFFIEFIALFFLKQYKSAMDEFRYYESLKRHREESLAILKILKNDQLKDQAFQIIEKVGFRSSPEKLVNGETTEILESKRLNKDEIEIFSKILDIVSKR